MVYKSDSFRIGLIVSLIGIVGSIVGIIIFNKNKV